MYRECLDAFYDCLLEQMVTSPTQGQNILDLFLTTNTTFIVKTTVLPGLSDHDIVQAELNVKPTKISKAWNIRCHMLPIPLVTSFTVLNLNVYVLPNT